MADDNHHDRLAEQRLDLLEKAKESNLNSLNDSKEGRGYSDSYQSKAQSSRSSNIDVPHASDIGYPDDNVNNVIDLLSHEDKQKLFDITQECFKIIGPDDEEEKQEDDDDDLLDQPEIRLSSTKSKFGTTESDSLQKKISMYEKSTKSTFLKKSTMRGLTPFHRERLDQQNKQVKDLMDRINGAPDGLEIWHIQNADGFTLLHQAAFKNQPVIVRKLIKLAKERVMQIDPTDQNSIMFQWVNKQSVGERFAAIHFASFNGNIEIAQMLIDEGASKHVVNKNGLNCLHVAAQGDQPGSLYYFHKIRELDIKKPDSRGSTPLHWAIFS